MKEAASDDIRVIDAVFTPQMILLHHMPQMIVTKPHLQIYGLHMLHQLPYAGPTLAQSSMLAYG